MKKVSQVNQQALAVKLSESSTKLTTASFSEQQQQQMVKALGACLAAQRTYGKQATDLEQLVKIFRFALDDFDADDILEAIREWLRTQAEFPTPADIRKLLDPRPTFDANVYRSLTEKARRDGASMKTHEWDYIRKYEQNAMKGI